MTTSVLVLGAGFGGLELSTRLSDQLADDVRVTLIDKSDAFVFGFSKLDVMFGRKTHDEVRLPYSALVKPGVEFRQETVLSIDPVEKRVVTDAGTREADVLVVALGADLDPSATPGLVDAGHEFYSPEGAANLRVLLEDFDGGDVVVAVLGGYFKCPPAPYETVFMLHDLLTRRGVRECTTIHLVTPMSTPIPVSGDISHSILGLLERRDIGSSHTNLVTSLDPGSRTAHLRDGTSLPFDLFLGIPVHRAPQVVVESGLAEDGWVPVDRATMATRFPDVYAIGDVTSAPVPRAGVIAEGEAATVAAGLVHRIRGGAPPPPFAGEVVCYVEMGDGAVGMVNVNFLSGPEPVSRFSPPTLELAEAKRQFGATRRRRWFGLE